MQKKELWSNMTGCSEMDTNKQTEDSNNIPNNVGKSESSDSIEVVTKWYKFLFKRNKDVHGFIWRT